MQHIRRNSFHYARLWICVAVLTCCAFSVNAQTDQWAELNAFVLKAYNAYQQKDQQTLFSLHSQSSPYFAEFKQAMLNDFSQRPNVKIEGNASPSRQSGCPG